ncbi:MAG TPA: putative ABC exporter domain-containing protein [Gemmatimonadaceae bacterium]|nr:putative ABC exporter domain-containing protein [Gemmatimonadaceae bacterium]
MTGAFWFLIRTSFRNRVITRVKRLRNPWYAVAALAGVAYFALILWGRSKGAELAGATPARSPFELLAPLLLAGAVMSTWIDATDLNALAFTQAEVAFLFTAPVARRQLIRYKLARMQLPVIISAFLFSVLFGRSNGPIPSVLVALAYCVLFSTIGLHRLGAALTRVSAYRYGNQTKRRSWFGVVFAAVLSAVMILQLIPAAGSARGAATPNALFERIAEAMSIGPARVVLYPFHVLSAPVFAHTVSAWATGILFALVILALHYWWVLGSDVVFEEAAAEVSERQARRIETMRRRQREIVPATARGARVLPLPASGRPAVAIIWKNLMVLVRTWTIGSLVRPLLIAGVGSVPMMRGAQDPAQVVAIVAACLAAMLLLVGAQSMRNDLRNDLLNLPLLKTAPLRGRDIVIAEVVSSATPLAVLQFTLLVVSAVALALSPHPSPLSVGLRTALLLVAPVALLALNGAMLTLANGVVVLFPAWMRLGPNAAGGVEMMGQAMFGVLGMVLAFIVLLVLPGAVVIALSLLLPAGPAVTAGFGALVGALVLLVETYGIARWIGRAFEGLEPTHLT